MDLVDPDRAATRRTSPTRIFHSIDFNVNGKYLISMDHSPDAAVWDLEAGTLLRELRHSSGLRVVRFSPDGRWVLTCTEAGEVQRWNYSTGQSLLPETRLHRGEISWADISYDGRWVATISDDKTACVWESTTGRLRFPPLRHVRATKTINSIQFSRDARHLVTASGNLVQVWDAVHGKPITPPLKHPQRVDAVTFSLDGRRIASVCSGGFGYVWDAKSGHLLGEPLGRPLRHDGLFARVQFSPDGRWIATSSIDSTARIREWPEIQKTINTCMWSGDSGEIH